MTALINNSAFDESGIQRPIIRRNRLRNRRRMIIDHYFNRFQERIYGLTDIILLLNIFFKLHVRDSVFRPAAASTLTVLVMFTAESRCTDSYDIIIKYYRVNKIFVYSDTRIAHGLGNV